MVTSSKVYAVAVAIAGAFYAPGSQARSAPSRTANAVKHRGGIDGSGGGNLRPEAGGAWFLGANKVINYCTIGANDFGVEPGEVNSAIEEAFTKWHAYTVAKHIDYFATTLQRHDPCNGQEDLTFYLGVETEAIAAEKTHYDKPIALNIRNSFDIDAGWSKGLIWLAKPLSVDPAQKLPDFANPQRLVGMLLHEIGHVFGNPHVADTIMSESITFYMSGDMSVDSRLGMIDQNRELSHCHACTTTYDGWIASRRLDSNSMERDSVASAREFTLLTGATPVGAPTAELQVEMGSYLSAATLVYRDGSGQSFAFPIEIKGQYCPNDAPSVFKFVLKDAAHRTSTYGGDGRACVYKGLISTRQNMKVVVSINLNMNTFEGVFLTVTYTDPLAATERSLFTLVPIGAK